MGLPTGAVARFLQRATRSKDHSGSSTGDRKSSAGGGGGGGGGGVHREMSLKAVKSQRSVYREESDGIGEMSFAGFPVDLRSCS